MTTEIQSIQHEFKDAQAVKQSYMPFVRDGGFFVASNEKFHLKDRVSVSFKLPGTEKIFTFIAEIIWIDSASAHSKRTAGIGVLCNGDEGEAFYAAARAVMATLKEDEVRSMTM